MLIVRAPVRISLAGGGTDLPAYSHQFEGRVISTTINRYFYVFSNVSDTGHLQITSSDYRTFFRYHGTEEPLWDGDLGLPRAILHHFGITEGLALFLASEIPPGTGLGGSGTVAVALVKAISTALSHRLSRQQVAELACHIEIEKLGQPIGKQDQYAAAFGGLNEIQFQGDEVTVTPLNIPADHLNSLQDRLLLFFTGSSRNASHILDTQKTLSEQKAAPTLQALHSVREMVDEMRTCLQEGNLDQVGVLLDRNWQQKKQFAPGITTPLIDSYYQLARSKGAIGGKITGAGGGGFLMLYCRQSAQQGVTNSLEAKGLKRMDFRFENSGAQVLMDASLHLPQLNGHRRYVGPTVKPYPGV